MAVGYCTTTIGAFSVLFVLMLCTERRERSESAKCSTLFGLRSITNLVTISTVRHPSVVRGNGAKTKGGRITSTGLRQQNKQD